MSKVFAILLGLVALVVVGVMGAFALPDATDSPLGDAAQSVKAKATNLVIDTSGIKDQVESLIEERRDDIAAATGLTATQVDEAIAQLNIAEWQAVNPPDGLTATATIDGAGIGVDGTITTYDDPGYVSVETLGQTVTFAVPESAQDYLPYLASVA